MMTLIEKKEALALLISGANSKIRNPLSEIAFFFYKTLFFKQCARDVRVTGNH